MPKGAVLFYRCADFLPLSIYTATYSGLGESDSCAFALVLSNTLSSHALPQSTNTARSVKEHQTGSHPLLISVQHTVSISALDSPL